MKIFSIVFSVCFCFAFWNTSHTQKTYPEQVWLTYPSPESAGLSTDKINKIKSIYESSQGAALLVAINGKIALSWGDNTRQFMVHSIRKSFIHSLIGREIEKGTLKMDEDLVSLGIDDNQELTDQEKTATLRDLLSSRSGIYLPSAYSSQGMINNLPDRGSYRPGEHWYYNNWDFNALATIYEQRTGKTIFEAFEKEIARPIGMEDFELDDCYYRFERDKSDHPAYLFRMSARDMARFGYLYLRNGKWKNDQIVPSDWIAKGTQTISDQLGDFGGKGTYGLLWWVEDQEFPSDIFYASGSGGHRIIVIPDRDMIIVHRTDTFEGKRVSEATIREYIRLLLDAQNLERDDAGLSTYHPSSTSLQHAYVGDMTSYVGTYHHNFLGAMTVTKEKSGYVLKNNIGQFQLYAQSASSFFIEDIEQTIVFVASEDENSKNTIQPKLGPDRSIESIIFYY